MIRPPADTPVPEPPDSILTLAGPADVEIKVQRSRFIGLARSAESPEEVRRLLAEASRRFHDARHVCFGYRVGWGRAAATRRSDDGEPSGTAGEPILKAIVGNDLTDTLVMVVRYFGGIKLGTGGLSRAYGETAAAALTQAGRKEILLGREFDLTFPYAREKTIRRLLTAHRGRPVDQEYAELVTWRVWLAHSAWQGFAAALIESTAGTVTLREVGPPTG